MGSVKDLIILEPAFENCSGVGNFNFSDRYSIFDWGEMPDHIVNKGRALAVMAAFNFEELEKRGISTHYKGLVTPDGRVIEFSNLAEGSNGSNIMQVAMAVVYHPTARLFKGEEPDVTEIGYDYSLFNRNRGDMNNYLIPLEIIFRNGLPKGSSVFKKIEQAKQIEDKEERNDALYKIYEAYGIDREPRPGMMLPEPVMDYTTKLEAGDRVLTEQEAYWISGLDEDDFENIGKTALAVNDYITEQAEKAGMLHYDGKVEMIYTQDDGVVLCDVLGTFDENRFMVGDEQVSKEFLRQWYKKNQPDFAPACEKWKQTGEGWQQRCDVKPIKLIEELSLLVSQMYMAGCNQYVERRIFDVPELPEIMEKLRPYR